LICGYDLLLSSKVICFIDTDSAEELFLLLGFIITQAHALGMIPLVALVTLNVKHIRIKWLEACAKGFPLMIGWV
jgi:hypothetical protein